MICTKQTTFPHYTIDILHHGRNKSKSLSGNIVKFLFNPSALRTIKLATMKKSIIIMLR